MPGPIHRAADVAAKHVGGVGPCRSGRRERTDPEFLWRRWTRQCAQWAGEVTGGFDWKRASGTTSNVLQTPHPYQRSYQPLIGEFTELTGINVNVDLVPEADYFTKLNTELAGGTGKHDAFMLGAYFI